MTRTKHLDRPTALKIHLPESEKAQLTLHLWSEVDGCVPLGSYQTWVRERIREFFSWKTLDLTPYGFGPGMFVRGPEEVITRLAARLEAATLAQAQADLQASRHA